MFSIFCFFIIRQRQAVVGEEGGGVRILALVSSFRGIGEVKGERLRGRGI